MQLIGEIEFPRDSEGFLRRECPNCEREFKLKIESHPSPIVGDIHDIYCPYCGAITTSDQLWTKDQLIKIQAEAELYLLKDLAARGFTTPSRIPSPTLIEPNDMEKITSHCHDSEVVKVMSGREAYFCIVCGNRFLVNF